MTDQLDIEEIKEQEVNENSGNFSVIFGVPGSGKSTFASTYPSPLFLDLEGTAGNIKKIKRLRIQRTKTETDGNGNRVDARDKAFMLLNGYRKQFLESENYKTLVIDGGKELIEICQDFKMKQMGRKEVEDHKYGDTYKKYREFTEDFIKSIIGNGKNLVIITHAEEITDVDANDEEFTIKRPLFADKQLVYKIPALANLVGIICVENGERYLDCVQTEKSILKNQYGIEEKIPADYKELEKKIKEFYKK